MIAEQPRAQDGDVEVVDLDAMTIEQLIQERAACWREIQLIEAQLADPSAIYRLGADEYVDWRRRAVWALRHRKIELHEIGNALQDRRRADALALNEQREGDRQRRQAEKRAEKRANWLANGGDPDRRPRSAAEKQAARDQYAEAQIVAQQRRTALLAAIEDDGMDGLLARVYCATRHLAGEGELPSSVTAEDRLALAQLGAYLRSRFGSGALKALWRGTLTADSVIEGGADVQA